VLENEQPQNVETARNTRRPMTRLITSTTGETHRLTPPKTVPKPPSLALCFVTLPESKKPITGHIDVVQARNGFIHLLDYKPKAREIDPVNQLVVHALVLASRARLSCQSVQVCLVWREGPFRVLSGSWETCEVAGRLRSSLQSIPDSVDWASPSQRHQSRPLTEPLYCSPLPVAC
jgi:hypothetical protein